MTTWHDQPVYEYIIIKVLLQVISNDLFHTLFRLLNMTHKVENIGMYFFGNFLNLYYNTLNYTSDRLV